MRTDYLATLVLLVPQEQLGQVPKETLESADCRARLRVRERPDLLAPFWGLLDSKGSLARKEIQEILVRLALKEIKEMLGQLVKEFKESLGQRVNKELPTLALQVQVEAEDSKVIQGLRAFRKRGRLEPLERVRRFPGRQVPPELWVPQEYKG